MNNRMGKFTETEWREFHVFQKVERHVLASDLAKAIRELETQERNTKRWAEERRQAKARTDRQRRQDLLALRTEDASTKTRAELINDQQTIARQRVAAARTNQRKLARR